MASTRLALRVVRTSAIFIGHLLTAAITTNVFDNELGHIFHSSTITAMLLREYAINSTIAFALGYFVFYKWHSEPGKWIWVVGVVLFAERSLSTWHGQHYSVLADAPTLLTVCSQMFGLQVDSPIYALMLVRTFFYSIGAWACWYVTRRRIVEV